MVAVTVTGFPGRNFTGGGPPFLWLVNSFIIAWTRGQPFGGWTMAALVLALSWTWPRVGLGGRRRACLLVGSSSFRI